METETVETTTEQDTEYQPVRRDVTLRFYRHAPFDYMGQKIALRSDEIKIERNGIKRTYTNPNNARYNRIAKIVRENRIPIETDLHICTEITFQADKE